MAINMLGGLNALRSKRSRKVTSRGVADTTPEGWPADTTDPRPSSVSPFFKTELFDWRKRQLAKYGIPPMQRTSSQPPYPVTVTYKDACGLKRITTYSRPCGTDANGNPVPGCDETSCSDPNAPKCYVATTQTDPGFGSHTPDQLMQCWAPPAAAPATPPSCEARKALCRTLFTLNALATQYPLTVSLEKINDELEVQQKRFPSADVRTGVDNARKYGDKVRVIIRGLSAVNWSVFTDVVKGLLSKHPQKGRETAGLEELIKQAKKEMSLAQQYAAIQGFQKNFCFYSSTFEAINEYAAANCAGSFANLDVKDLGKELREGYAESQAGEGLMHPGGTRVSQEEKDAAIYRGTLGLQTTLKKLFSLASQCCPEYQSQAQGAPGASLRGLSDAGSGSHLLAGAIVGGALWLAFAGSKKTRH